MEKFMKVFSNLEKWETGSKKIIANGTKLICHVPHIAPQAWLHEIYAGLSEDKINELKRKISDKLSNDYVEFLKVANGINIFSDSLSIWGVRTSYVRKGDEAIQPYDLIAENEDMKGQFPESWLMIGSYSWDGSTVGYNLSNNSNKVFLCKPDSDEIVKEWDDLWTWLNEEIERLSLLFDMNGKKYDEDAPTIPV